MKNKPTHRRTFAELAQYHREKAESYQKRVAVAESQQLRAIRRALKLLVNVRQTMDLPQGEADILVTSCGILALYVARNVNDSTPKLPFNEAS